MELLRDTNFDFMKYRKFWVFVSLGLVLAGIFFVFVHGQLNIGVDFAGGTQINLKLKERPDVDELRSLLPPQTSIQSFGDEASNEIMVRTRLAEGSEESSRDQVVAALDRRYNQDRGTKVDLNRVGADQVATLLTSADPDRRGPQAAPAHYLTVAEAILDQRREISIFNSWDDLSRIEGVTPAVLSALQTGGYLGDFAVLGVEDVGPQIGSELRRKGFLAVALSLVGMLIYIWFRFELRFGVGAIMACVHDVLVTLFFFAASGYEFNLTTVAAFLTLIGYSVNDTVVIFDRIRENMRKSRREPLIDVMNRSINQTLSRTILTGGSTLLVLACLWQWGGEVIKGFAFVLLVGILVGTYSSIYVASPFALLWERVFGSKSKIR
ncbi:MAG TPA: protein translocase subunit SecF, partial [Thermoanaerobaculia bacterium]|nr:protein translocase subunit SecF [Thermoanaerobaculia bacterium]